MKLFSWNVNHRRDVDRQGAAIRTRAPDVLALQEVGRGTQERIHAVLTDFGLGFIETSFASATDQPVLARRYGLLVASRWPIRLLRLEECDLPWPERLLSVLVESPDCEIELHTAYVPPGSSHGVIKVETLEGIYRCLACRCDRPRILCGDFNLPQEERSDGTVVTWGESVGKNGAVKLCSHSLVEGRWDAAERAILLGLAKYNLTDCFRRVHGYKSADFSWHFQRRDKIIRRRFDHVFACESLNPLRVAYLHAFREQGLSDHSPIEVTFQLRRSERIAG